MFLKLSWTTKNTYTSISLLTSIYGETNLDGLKFQQDNASCPKSAVMMHWVSNNDVALLEWPTHYPDLNSMERLFGNFEKEYQGPQHHAEIRIKTRVRVNLAGQVCEACSQHTQYNCCCGLRVDRRKFVSSSFITKLHYILWGAQYFWTWQVFFRR